MFQLKKYTCTDSFVLVFIRQFFSLHRHVFQLIVICTICFEFTVLKPIISWYGSSVGISTDYGLDGPGSNPGGGARFSAPVQTDPGAHPASCTMGTGSFPGVNYGRGVLLTTHPLLVPWSWNSKAVPLPTLWATPSL
jgi:hypothetical protein